MEKMRLALSHYSWNMIFLFQKICLISLQTDISITLKTQKGIHAVLNSKDFSGYFFIKESSASISTQAIRDLGLTKEKPSENDVFPCPMKFLKSINFSNGFADFDISKLKDYRGIKLNSIVIPYDFQINGEYFLLEEYGGEFHAVLLNDFVVTTDFKIAAPKSSMSFIAMKKEDTGKEPI